MKKYQVKIHLSEERVHTITVKASDTTWAMVKTLNGLPLHERDRVIRLEIMDILP